MTTVVDEDVTLHGLPAVELDNGRLRVLVLPGAGGRVWQVQCLRTGRRLLWNNPRTAPTRLPVGTSFDDNFSGGWDELFPNDLPEALGTSAAGGAETYPDHGELWTAAWRHRVERHADGAATVVLDVETPISQCTLTKRVRLAPGSAVLEVDETLTHHGPHPLPALWKQHLALHLDDGGTVELPGGRAELADWGRPRTGAAGDVFDWPHHGETDFSVVPGPGSRAVEFTYVTDLPEPWCGLSHPDGSGVRLSWTADVVDTVWLFASHGAWRGNRVLVLEPCTGTPLSVAEGVAPGTHRTLHPGESWSLSMRLHVLSPPSARQEGST